MKQMQMVCNWLGESDSQRTMDKILCCAYACSAKGESFVLKEEDEYSARFNAMFKLNEMEKLMPSNHWELVREIYNPQSLIADTPQEQQSDTQ